MIGHGFTIFLAVCAAVFMAIGMVVRQRATMDVPSEDGVSTKMLATLLRRPLWWAGSAAAILGFVFQALALIKGSLILVQPILVSALLFTLPLSARLSGRRVTRGEWTWAGVLTASLVVFVLLAKPGPKENPASTTTAIAVSVVCGVLILACIAIAVRFPAGWQRAMLLAISVGVLFGLVVMLTKIFMRAAAEDGLLAQLVTPVPYLLVGLGVFAMLLQQSAFHAGALQMSVPTMLVLEPVVAILLGAMVLGEKLDADRYEAFALTVVIAVMTVATIALARDEGAYEAELELKAARDPV